MKNIGCLTRQAFDSFSRKLLSIFLNIVAIFNKKSNLEILRSMNFCQSGSFK